ncbi:MAG: amino acid permease [Gemmatimonadota bacterium]|nr:amino acid permease [Gemmatimonadota bacterium]MDQ8147492.1 amino acid permease [Gemmatimonadota bacterium]MDQ8149429.1 amino acid permease [Gemmatimonadota bacterium]MDQ8157592.1 amino acid permease [Gemmatimonadota bacterium]MDQ8176898.1 amino acid permease [Gemmatimonadota bacterium]
MSIDPVGYERRLGLPSATLLVVGGIIGSGVFLNPAVVAQRVGTAPLTLLAWGLGAGIAILGAFIFAELGARLPAVGGGYAYLREAFGPLPAFLYGWALLLAIASGAIAAVAVTCASYLALLVGLPAPLVRPLALLLIAGISVVNAMGIAPGVLLQNLFTVGKLAAIAMLVVVGLGGGASEGSTLAVTTTVAPDGVVGTLRALATALVPVLFAYGGWQQTNFVAEEMVDPRRDLPRALVLGVLIVAVAYVSANLAYLRALGVDGLAASHAPAAEAMDRAVGDLGRGLIAVGIAVSTAGFLNVVILVTPRVYQAMARDGVFFRGLAALHPRTRAPVAAITLQAAWSGALVLSGGYGDLLDWVTFADWIFFGATAATLFVFRRRAATATATALAPFHPWSTGLFIVAAGFVVGGAVLSNPANALRGTLMLAAGVPAYAWWRRRGTSPAQLE